MELRPVESLLAVTCLTFLLAGVHHGGAVAPSVRSHAATRPAAAPAVSSAVAVLRPIGDSGVGGTIRLVREGGAVRVTGRIAGLQPGQHGFHVHEYGDLTDLQKGESAGGHYNPTNLPHGAPASARRHVGDLGNITANAQGVATINHRDPVIQLTGAHSILGRAIVVHANPDRFTQPSGNAGGRVAAGVIGIAKPGK